MSRKFPSYQNSTPVSTSQGALDSLSGAVVTGAAAQRTLTLDVRGLNRVRMAGVYTQAGAGLTGFTATPSVSYDGGTTYQQVRSESLSAGVGTMSLYSKAAAITATGNVDFGDFEVTGATHLKTVFAGAGAPNAGDTLSVSTVGIVDVGG